MLELTLRLVFSLAVVIGLLMLLAKLGAKRFKGGPDALIQVVQRQALSRTSAVSVITVGSRVLVLGTTEQQVSVLAELDPEELELDLPDPDASGPVVQTSYDPVVQTSYDVVARTANPFARAFGGPASVARTSTGPSTPDTEAAAVAVPGSVSEPRRGAFRPDLGGPLAGSVLSPDTWRRTLAALSHGAGVRSAGPRS